LHSFPNHQQVDKGAELSQRLVQKVVVDPMSSTYKAVTSLPSRLLDRAEALLDHYLPEEKHKGGEGTTVGKSRRDSQDGRVRYAHAPSHTHTIVFSFYVVLV
jgi:hypothetical protein